MLAINGVMNIGGVLRLFQNNLTPNPANIVTDFVEATFVGYSQKNLINAFGGVWKVVSGIWQTTSTIQTFSCVGEAPQIIYGWYITYTNVLYYSTFLNPPTISNGVNLPVQVTLQEQALVVACP